MRAVFVGGCERSGTTLMGSVLGGHSKCVTTPESHFKIEPLLLRTIEADNVLDSAAFEAVKLDMQFRLWGLNLRSEDERRLHRAETVEQLMYDIARCYGRKIGRDSPEVWVDHTPSNIKYAWRLRRNFTEAKFIHVVRDGRAVAASLLRVRSGPNTMKACAEHWMGRIAAGMALESVLPDDAILRIHYEELVADTKVTVQRICRFLDLDYQEGMISGSGYRPVRFGRRVNPMVGRPPSPDRLNAWQGDLTGRQIEIFEAWTGDLLPVLGYPLRFGLKARNPSWAEKLRMDVEELARRVVNAVSYRLSRRRHVARAEDRRAYPGQFEGQVEPTGDANAKRLR